MQDASSDKLVSSTDGDVPSPAMLTGRQLAQELSIEFAETLAGRAFSAEFLAKIPIAFARDHAVIGLCDVTDAEAGAKTGNGPGSDQSNGLTVAIADLASWDQLDILSRFLKRTVQPLIAPKSAILAAINQAYQQQTGQAQKMIAGMGTASTVAGSADREVLIRELHQLAGGREDLLDVSARAPVIKLVNLMLFEAVKALASDVHVQPYEEKLIVRMRIDGVLYDSFDLPKSVQEEVISRVKVMGRMNIAEKRLPQDGRATVQVGDRLVDLRIASLPTSFGERVVIRLLDKSARLYQLQELGMPPQTLDSFRELISVEHGLVLVTGPTGGGKTTTLYAALKELNATERNVLTLEDPIEYQLEGISQTQVSEKKGMTFASGLRSVLRQDPDVIMVGEIRDRETATMAIQSALTGHLVFSTLHTNDAASAVTRLLDLGIEPYLVASSLIGVLAQRLVRRVCGQCATPAEPSERELAWIGLGGRTAGHALRRGTGCIACRGTGLRGRMGIFELLTVGEAVRRRVQSRASASQIKSAAVAAGMRTLRDDGVEKVRAGLTTVDEVERVTMRELEALEAQDHEIHPSRDSERPGGGGERAPREDYP